MAPETAKFHTRTRLGYVLLKRRGRIGRQEVTRLKSHKFFLSETVLAQSSLVHTEESERAQIKHPHGLWVFEVEKPVLRLRFLERFSFLFEAGNFLEKLPFAS